MEVLVLATTSTSDLEYLMSIVKKSNVQLTQYQDPKEILLDSCGVTISSRKQQVDRNVLLKWLEYEPNSSEHHATVSPLPILSLKHHGAPHHSKDPSKSDMDHLTKKIAKRDKNIRSLQTEIESLKRNLQEATEKSSRLEIQQNQFLSDVEEMKEEYDKLTKSHQYLLWEYLPTQVSSLNGIPPLSPNTEESMNLVGKYTLDDVLGHGQYATVYAASSQDEGNSSSCLAIKAIEKDKLIDIGALERIHSEISSLQDPLIKHENLLQLKEVIHTKSHIYLVTDRGGKDLFEFFGVHQFGVQEEMVKSIIQKVGEAVLTLHTNDYCHRDLKPENILYSIQDNAVKVIDFGLCTKCLAGKKELDDFCGSPGFFAPEILLQDKYDGQKADVWSIGCILLELVLGNSMFVSLWMGMYELNTLKDRRKFAELLRKSLLGIRELCQTNSKFPYSNKLKSLLMALLTERPNERLTVHQMLTDPWFDEDSPPSTSPTKIASYSPKRSPSPVKTKSMAHLLKPMNIQSQSQQLQVQQQPQEQVVYLPESAARIRPLSAEEPVKLSLPSIPGSSPEKSKMKKTSTSTSTGHHQYDWDPNN